MKPERLLSKRPKTKIICTMGPSTLSEKIVESLVQTGMSIARLNLSHGSLRDHTSTIQMVKRASENLSVPVGIMIDIPGAKYRTGPLSIGVLNLKPRDILTLTSRDVVGNSELVAISPHGIHKDATVGNKVLLDDGLIELDVKEIRGQDVVCEVVRGGRLTERRGVSTPGTSPSYPFPTEDSIRAIQFAAKHHADFIALSTIRNESEIVKARNILKEHGADANVISKIERVEALENFDSILAVSDGIMVARGDMGVEVRLAEVPMIQKDLITRCNTEGKPVITATQMLESMVKSPVPTRAEVTDVANAIYDGTDAIMLSGETSVGQYPIEATSVMAEVAIEAESALPYENMLLAKRNQLKPQTDDALSYDACRTALQLDASVIVAFTESGSTAGRVSKYRPIPPILALTPSEKIRRRLTIHWGVVPITVPQIHSVDDIFAVGEEVAIKYGAKPGSLGIMVAGLPIGVAGSTNLLRVMEIPREPSSD